MIKRSSLLSKIFVALVLVVLYLPIIVVVVYSFNDSKYGNWTFFSTAWYEKLFRNRSMMEALMNSLKLGVMSSLAAAILGTAGAVGMSKSHFRTMGLLENVSMVPLMIPEIILGMAYMTFFSLLSVPYGMVTLVIAHTTFCVPYIYIQVKARLEGMDPSIAEAALDLGARPLRMFFDITLPLIMPAVMSGTLLAFAMSMDDVVITFFVTGTDTNTLPLKIFSMLKTGVTPEVNALSTLMLAVIMVVLLVGNFAPWRAMGALFAGRRKSD